MRMHSPLLYSVLRVTSGRIFGSSRTLPLLCYQWIDQLSNLFAKCESVHFQEEQSDKL